MSELSDSVCEFLYREAALLDEKRFGEWLNLFSDTGYYWVPNDPGVTDPDSNLALIYDKMDRLAERVWRLDSAYAHAQVPASATTHLLSNVRLLDDEKDELIAVQSKFAVHEVRRHDQRVYTGTYTHRLRRGDGEFLIESKRVDMIQAQVGLGNVSILI